MNNVVIYYGSKEKFNRIIPKDYRNLTDLVYESDKDGKTMKLVIPNQHGEYPKEEKEEKIFVKNFVISSDEYAGVREHVITNFINFLAKFDVENLYIQNPPLQISEQILRLYPNAAVKYQRYKRLTTSHLLKINEEYDNKIIGQEDVKLELLQALFPLTMKYRQKPVVLLFYGKSGIGKTETAKYLAQIIGEPIFRKQFSMYQNNQFATYLFGGAHYEKSFAKDLLDRKSNVLLLYEFDKAHPSFHSAFYQLFDEGIYEDQNYYLTLKKSIIICTSNYTDLKDIEDNLGSAIYNRFDKIIHFNDLSVESKLRIGQIAFQKYEKNFNYHLNEATKKNERNIIIIGVIGIVITLAMLGLSIWFLIAQLDIANQTNSSVGVAIGGFIGMIVGIALFITVGILIYCNAIRNVHIRNTINNKVESSQNSKNN